VPDFERLAEQRIVAEVELPDGKVVRRAPIGVDLALLFSREWLTDSLNLAGIEKLRSIEKSQKNPPRSLFQWGKLTFDVFRQEQAG
jgi:hypothetical protein